MRRWSLLIAALVIGVMALALPFLYPEEADTYGPLGFVTQVWVRDATADADAAGLATAIPEFAHSARTNVARYRAATDDAFFGRQLFVAVGAPERPVAAWVDGGYPSFSRRATTEVLPWASLDLAGLDPRGYYLMDGSLVDGALLVDVFQRHGFRAEVYSLSALEKDVAAVTSGVRGASAATALLACVVLVGSAVLLNAKPYGVGRLFGHSGAWLFAYDLRGALPGVLTIVAALAAGAGGVLAWYNGLHHAPQYLRLVGVLALAMAVVVIAAHAAAVWLTGRVRLSDALKGQVPTRPTMMAAYAVRVAALALTVTTLVGSVSLVQPALEADRGNEVARARAGGAPYILLNGSLGEADTGALVHGAVAAWLQRADVDGRVILARDVTRKYAQISAGATSGVGVLVVNPSYVAHQPVLGPDGVPLAPSDLSVDRPTLLVPADLAAQAGAVRDVTRVQLADSRSRAGSDADVDPEIRPIASGQEHFTYGSALGRAPGTLVDPAILVVPPQLRVWGTEYVDMAEDLVLTTPGLPADVSADPRLSAAFLATLPVTQKMADDALSTRAQLVNGALNSALGVVLLMVVVATSVSVYVKAWSQRLYVRSLHGWGRWEANPLLLLLEVGLAAATVGWAAQAWLRVRGERLSYGSIPPPRSLDAAQPQLALAIAVGVAVTSFALALAVLVARERRLLMNRAVDAL